MFNDKIGKYIVVKAYSDGYKEHIFRGILESVKQSIHNNEIIYHLHFSDGRKESAMMRKIVDIKDIGDSEFDKSWESCKDKFSNFYKYNNPFSADVENYSDCGTTNNRPRDLYLPPKKEIMKVKVQTIIEAAEKALVVATEKYRVKFDKSLTQYTADVEEFLATDFSNVTNVIAPIFQGVRNDTPLIKQDLRILNALAESEVELNSDSNISRMFNSYVANVYV